MVASPLLTTKMPAPTTCLVAHETHKEAGLPVVYADRWRNEGKAAVHGRTATPRHVSSRTYGAVTAAGVGSAFVAKNRCSQDRVLLGSLTSWGLVASLPSCVPYDSSATNYAASRFT